MIANKFSKLFLDNSKGDSVTNHIDKMCNIADIYNEPFTVERADEVFDDFFKYCNTYDLKVSKGEVIIEGDSLGVNATIEDIAMYFMMVIDMPLRFEPNLVKRNFNEI